MKKIYCLLICLSFIGNIHAQTQNKMDFSNVNSAKEGNIIIDGFFGWPYFNGVLLSSLSTNYKIKNTNHLGGKFEYMLTDKMGLGGEFTYANASANYQSASNGLWYNAGISKIRVLGRFNYHFSTTKTIDPYLTFGMGYKKTTYYDKGNSNNDYSFNLFPVSCKIAVGTRIYFNDTFGFNAEIGLGGPLIAAGLSLKL